LSRGNAIRRLFVLAPALATALNAGIPTRAAETSRISRAPHPEGGFLVLVLDPAGSTDEPDSWFLTLRNLGTSPAPLKSTDRWTFLTASGDRIRTKPDVFVSCRGESNVIQPHDECEIVVSVKGESVRPFAAVEWKGSLGTIAFGQLSDYEPARLETGISLPVSASLLGDPDIPLVLALRAWIRLDESGKAIDVAVLDAPPGPAGQAIGRSAEQVLRRGSWRPSKRAGQPVPDEFTETIWLTGGVTVERTYSADVDDLPARFADFLLARFNPANVRIAGSSFEAGQTGPLEGVGLVKATYSALFRDTEDSARPVLHLDVEANRLPEADGCSCSGPLSPGPWANRFLAGWESAAGIHAESTVAWLPAEAHVPADISSGTDRSVSPPILLHKIQPEYPDPARQAHVQGTVLLDAVIGEKGDVESLTVRRSVPGLDGSSVRAVCCWKYSPALDAAGKAVPVHFTVRIDYSLH
jgi:TonB family protein